MIIRTLLSIYFLMYTAGVYAGLECNVIFPLTHSACSQGIKIYHGGSIVPTENYGNKICFFVKNSISVTRMFLLIVNPANLEYNLKKGPFETLQNTIQSRTIAAEKDYKLYAINFSKNTWTAEECELNENRIVPDTTLILFYNPSYISHLDVQNSIDIYIKNDIAEEQLRDEEIKYLFHTLHTDSLYDKPRQNMVTYKLCKQIVVGG